MEELPTHDHALQEAESCGCCTRVTFRHAATPAPEPAAHVLKEFQQYLLSDDTRLPLHSSLANTAAHPEDYTTYSGEDVWKGPNVATTAWSHDGPTPTATASVQHPSTEELQRTSQPPSGAAVNFLMLWVHSAMRALGGGGGGVVLCGKYRCVTDCAWTSASREVSLHNPRDVLVAMRMSSLFLEDLERQADEAFQTSAAACGGASLQPTEDDTIMWSLERAVPISSSTLFRLFFCQPCDPLHHFDGVQAKQMGDWDTMICLGSQRATDVLLPGLVLWTDAEESAALDAMRSRVCASASGLSTCDSTGQQLLSHLVSGKHKNSSSPDTKVMVVAVDVVFESTSLPIFMLSASVWTTHETNEEATTSDDTDAEEHAFFCLFRNASTFCSVVQELSCQETHSTKRCRSLFIAHEAEELRPVVASDGGGHHPEDVEALLHEMTAHRSGSGAPVMPDFVREMLEQSRRHS
jgi:hypothetical protein